LVCDDRLLQDRVAHRCCSRGSRTPTHADSYAATFGYSYGDCYCYCNCYRDCYSHCNCNCDGYSYIYPDTDSDSERYSNRKTQPGITTSPHAAASPVSGR